MKNDEPTMASKIEAKNKKRAIAKTIPMTVTIFLCLAFPMICSSASSSSPSSSLSSPMLPRSSLTTKSGQYNEMKDLLSSYLISSTPTAMRRNVLPLKSSSIAFSLNHGRSRHHPSMLLGIRGGDTDFSDDDESILDMDTNEDEDDTEDEESEEEEEETADDESEEEETEDESEEEDEESEDEDTDDESVPDTPLSSSPVKVVISTGLKSSILDQSLELTCSRKRDVASLRVSVSRQLRGRPPPSTVRLLLGNRILRDEELVDEIAPDEDDEDEDDDDDDEDDDDDMVKVHLILDIVPPIDPKFATELPERIEKMSDSELLDAYVTNVVAMQRNNAELLKASLKASPTTDGDDVEGGDEEKEEDTPISTTVLPDSVSMRMDAMTMRERMLENFPEDVVKRLQEVAEGENVDDVEGAQMGGVSDPALAESIKRKGRRNVALKGGATMNVKRSLQRNLNINWPDTIRNFFLFLFFGYFGGRNTASRTLMLLCAPMCFILQARPVKIALKQLFYAVGKPPSIILSLLPAPQQAIMSLNYNSALVDLYGEKTALEAAKALGISFNLNNDDDDDDDFTDEDDFDSDEYDEYD